MRKTIHRLAAMAFAGAMTAGTLAGAPAAAAQTASTALTLEVAKSTDYILTVPNSLQLSASAPTALEIKVAKHGSGLLAQSVQVVTDYQGLLSCGESQVGYAFYVKDGTGSANSWLFDRGALNSAGEAGVTQNGYIKVDAASYQIAPDGVYSGTATFTASLASS